MKKSSKLLLIGGLAIGALGVAPKAAEAAWSPAIYTITGNEYVDVNQDGRYRVVNGDVPLKNQQVELYRSLADAEQGTNLVASRATSAVGTYSFTKLSKGTYYLKHGITEGYRPLEQANTAINAEGEAVVGITQVEINRQLVVNVDLGAVKVNPIKFHVFNDINGNGVMDSTEKIENHRTMMIINLENTLKMVESGELDEIDADALVSQALSGSLDIGENAIMLRTTKGSKPIEFSEMASGAYVVIRSPFNLSLMGGILGDIPRIEALISLIGEGDISAIIENPDLIATNDITTNEDLQYVKELANFFPQVFDEVERVDLGKYLGGNVGTSVNNILAQGRGLVSLVNNVPNLRLLTVDKYNNSFETQGFNVRKTSDIFVGVKRHAATTGYVFDDKNGNGKKDFGEKGLAGVTVSLFNEAGELVQTAETPANGQYRFDKIAYDETMYLVVETDKNVAPLYVEEVPANLVEQKVVARIMLPFTEATYQVSQNIGLSEQ